MSVNEAHVSGNINTGRRAVFVLMALILQVVVALVAYSYGSHSREVEICKLQGGAYEGNGRCLRVSAGDI